MLIWNKVQVVGLSVILVAVSVGTGASLLAQDGGRSDPDTAESDLRRASFGKPSLTIRLLKWESVKLGNVICSKKCNARYGLANGIGKCRDCDRMRIVNHFICTECAQRQGRCEICGTPVKPLRIVTGDPLPLQIFMASGTDPKTIVWDLSCPQARGSYRFVIRRTEDGTVLNTTTPKEELPTGLPWRCSLRPEPLPTTFADITFGRELAPGKYTIEAHYINRDDGSTHVRLREYRGRIWTGHLVSPPVEVEIHAK